MADFQKQQNSEPANIFYIAAPTSITVPFVITPRDVYIGDCGFFFTPIIDKQNVAFNYEREERSCVIK